MTARILVVDDNLDHRFLTRRAIQALKKDIAVDLAPDGPAGLERAWADPPDLVLLDVKMPGMDGFEVLRRLRADPRSKDLRVVLFSSSETEADRVRGEELGATGFVTKPLDAASFARVVRETLERFLGA